MPGCVLRAYGTAFNVDQFLKESSLSPCAIFRKGEKKSQRSKVEYKKSGITVVASEASGEKISKQFKDALTFLKRHKSEIVRLKKTAGVETVNLDFGVTLRIGYKDCFWPGINLPEPLIQAAAELRLELAFSFFPNVNPTYLLATDGDT